jgi:hypothetical protein
LYQFAPGSKRCFHEPACPAQGHKFAEQYWHAYAEPKYFEPDYEPVHQLIMTSLRENSLTIIKDMSTAFKNFTQDHLTEMQSVSDVYGVFLIRDPDESLYSVYQKCDRQLTQGLIEFLGFRETVEMIRMFRRQSIPHMVIRSEDFNKYPAKTIERISQMIGLEIPFVPKWAPLPADFDFYEEWHECKKPPIIEQWHGEACRCTGFGGPRPVSTKIVDAKHLELYNGFLRSMTEAYHHIIFDLK